MAGGQEMTVMTLERHTASPRNKEDCVATYYDDGRFPVLTSLSTVCSKGRLGRAACALAFGTLIGVKTMLAFAQTAGVANVDSTPIQAPSKTGGSGFSLADVLARQQKTLYDEMNAFRDSLDQRSAEENLARAEEIQRISNKNLQDANEAASLAGAYGVEQSSADQQDVINDLLPDAEDVSDKIDEGPSESAASPPIFPNFAALHSGVQEAPDDGVPTLGDASRDNTNSIVPESLSASQLPQLLSGVDDNASTSHGPILMIATTSGPAELAGANAAAGISASAIQGAAEFVASKGIDIAAKYGTSPAALLSHSSDTLQQGLNYELRDLVRSSEKDNDAAESAGSWLRDRIISKFARKVASFMRQTKADIACGDTEQGTLDHDHCELWAAANPMNISEGIEPYSENVELKFANYFSRVASEVTNDVPQGQE